ncbi:hypothetical protein ONZ45_g3929 [Pleurotus djamor]|nr:hypothetical protein ONZ45_g3929 [Pleurotus djamor]
MPTATIPVVPHYTPAPPTTEPLDYAELAIVDISEANTPEGRLRLAEQVRDAMTNVGFFYVINHGLDEKQASRIVDIGNVLFDGTGDEEKNKYAGSMKTTGSYQGYKPRQYWHIDGGIRDQVEHYNINRDVTKRQHPQAIRPFLPEIKAFAEFNHFKVLHPVLRLLAIGLELPEDAFVNLHGYDAVGETYVRFMKYYPRSDHEEETTKHVWLKGHTDFGTITILWSQPVSGLQILTKQGQWKWIKHIENALVINAGDAMEFLSGGFYPATIHRVIQPPVDQRNKTRLGAFYFCMTDDNVLLKPLLQSSILQRSGAKKRFDDDATPTMEQWRKSRTSAYGQTELRKGTEEGVEEELINGVLVKHYN